MLPGPLPDSAGESRLLETLEQLLAVRATDVKGALDASCLLVAAALRADKVDAFFYDPSDEILVAASASDTPMGRLQHELGLNRLLLADAGRTVEVFETGASYRTGRVDQDPGESAAMSRDLGARSIMAVAFAVDGQRRGVLQVDAAQPDLFSADDQRFLEAVALWVGMVVQRAELTKQVAREAAAQARRMVAEELVDALAHDLRTPLTPLRGRLDIIRRQAAHAGEHGILRNVDAAGDAVHRLDTMIARLLDTARLAGGVFHLAPRPVDLAALARETANLLRAPGADLRVQAPAALWWTCDPERVCQALENLLGNALKHSPEGTPIVVSVERDGAWAVLTVRDEGRGVAPDLLPTLFERFARGHDSTGLGLGLYLARGIAEAHGGALTVDSRPGDGTAFHLALPPCRA